MSSKSAIQLPLNLQIIPCPDAEVAVKKQMKSVLWGMRWAELTMKNI
jgi:hypothetical protein